MQAGMNTSSKPQVEEDYQLLPLFLLGFAPGHVWVGLAARVVCVDQ